MEARIRGSRGVLAAVFAAALGLAALAGCSPVIQTDMRNLGDGYTTDSTTVQIVSSKLQGKNVYIPSTVVVTAGRRYTLSVFNTTDTPHGFEIAGIGIREVLPPGEEHQISLPPLEGGRVYQIHCQLHPAHRTATLVVLPAQ